MQRVCAQVAEHGVTVFLSHPGRDPDEGLMYNTVFVIGPDGSIIGRHRKVKALRGPEARVSSGSRPPSGARAFPRPGAACRRAPVER